MIWHKPVRKRRARHRQVRRNVMTASALRNRRTRTASVTSSSSSAESSGDESPPEFDGYAVELLTAVADLLRVHLEFYAVLPPPFSGASSVRGRTRDYGMWSTLVDQLLTEASAAAELFFCDFSRSSVDSAKEWVRFIRRLSVCLSACVC